ncbi:MAG: hypothetical protein ABIH41_00865 [Nanoarchaeota archaeon]
MEEIIYSPVWFYGKDIIIDAIGVVILSLIGATTLKYYRLSRDRKYLFFASSFFAIALSFLAKMLGNLKVYSLLSATRQQGALVFQYHVTEASAMLILFSFLFYRILLLFGWYGLYLLYHKGHNKADIIVMAFFLFVITFLTSAWFFLFHLTLLLLIGLVVWTLARNCKKTRSGTAKLLPVSFLILALGHVMFLFIGSARQFYVIGEVIQLIGYFLLLLAFILVLRHGKKT